MKHQNIIYDLDTLDQETYPSFLKSIKKGLVFMILLIVFLFLQVLSIPIVHALGLPTAATGQAAHAKTQMPAAIHRVLQ